jgi:predicted nucleotidyltransferase
MRIQDYEREIILAAISRYAPDVEVYLFGSRADDTKRGGDIDLLLIGENMKMSSIRSIKIEIKDNLGDQKIDIVYESPENRTNFGKMVQIDAVKL